MSNVGNVVKYGRQEGVDCGGRCQKCSELVISVHKW